MVSIFGNVKYSDGTISVLKDFSLLSSNPMGPIIGSLRIYSLLDLQIQLPKMNVGRLPFYEAKVLFSEGRGRM